MSERIGKGAVVVAAVFASTLATVPDPLPGVALAKAKLSEEERERIVEQARRELPELDRRYRKAVTNLDRISRGLRPKA